MLKAEPSLPVCPLSPLQYLRNSEHKLLSTRRRLVYYFCGPASWCVYLGTSQKKVKGKKRGTASYILQDERKEGGGGGERGGGDGGERRRREANRVAVI